MKLELYLERGVSLILILEVVENSDMLYVQEIVAWEVVVEDWSIVFGFLIGRCEAF